MCCVYGVQSSDCILCGCVCVCLCVYVCMHACMCMCVFYHVNAVMNVVAALVDELKCVCKCVLVILQKNKLTKHFWNSFFSSFPMHSSIKKYLKMFILQELASPFNLYFVRFVYNYLLDF